MQNEKRYYLLKGIKSGKEYTLKIEGDDIVESAMKGIDSNVYEMSSVSHMEFYKALEKKAFEKKDNRIKPHYVHPSG